ncbi:MAG: tRNA pseudouridine(38-40) synthase TruA [Chitinispirillaceae bacterium]|nr:tRNA pseudouridine(38-40) synthase TruA [Chitinispirillaceae bacterium]
MTRYFFRVEYDGTAYGGWQAQKNAPSIQKKLEDAFSTATRSPCRVIGAGRTDAGVHARAQGAHIDLPKPVDPNGCERSVNGLLPRDIAVYGLRAVDASFHARYSAVSRRYCYYLCERKRPLMEKHAWIVLYDIEWERIAQSLPTLLGTHDFISFCASGSGTKHARCTVTAATIEQKQDMRVVTIEANRFVYSMVRSLVGTLVDIGRGRMAESLENLIALKDRKRCGQTAPAWGLVLDTVIYPGEHS